MGSVRAEAGARSEQWGEWYTVVYWRAWTEDRHEGRVWVAPAEQAVSVAMCWIGGLPYVSTGRLLLIDSHGGEQWWCVEPDTELVAVAQRGHLVV